MNGPGSIGRGAALMASGTAVSRVTGLLRMMVLVAAIGVTGEAADAFSVANKLPNILFMLLAGGVLNAVLVPQVVRAYKRDAGQEYVDRLLTLGFVVLAVATVVLTFAAPLLVNLYADAAPDQMALATTFAYWCIPQLFFYGVYALLGQVLNARGSFGPFMWAPVVNNLVAIGGFVAFLVVFGDPATSGVGVASSWTSGQVALLAGVSTLGVVMQALVLVPSLRRAGVRYRFRWGLRGSGLGRAGQVATWTLVGLAIGLLGNVVVSRIASRAPSASEATTVASNNAYDVAFSIFMLPHSLVTVSLATALFTRLSGQAHDQDLDGVRSTFSHGVRVVGLFTVAAAGLLLVLARPVTDIIAFNSPADAVDATARVVQAMVVGLPAFGAWSMAQRVYYAYEDARGMVPIQVAMAVVVAGGALLVSLLAPPSWWTAGAGLAMSVSYLVGAVAATWYLRRRLGRVDGGRIVRLHVRALVAVVPAMAVAWLATRAVAAGLSDGLGQSVVVCVVAGGLGGATYLGVLRLLRVTELDGLLRPVLARLRPGRG
ncbi:murein biosynthesis integral membrane protein MurJ [Cellulomonas fimi]|uniref:murein biosynthesis integral membrane protein MurJ n=1 Tax=Cellulomonas fimi TaxID=1708 RepID=UPI00235906E5|nr:murein biosynthesis integral membrane protein MurJ [Cellulomonas fimi]